MKQDPKENRTQAKRKRIQNIQGKEKQKLKTEQGLRHTN